MLAFNQRETLSSSQEHKAEPFLAKPTPNHPHISSLVFNLRSKLNAASGEFAKQAYRERLKLGRSNLLMSASSEAF